RRCPPRLRSAPPRRAPRGACPKVRSSCTDWAGRWSAWCRDWKRCPRSRRGRRRTGTAIVSLAPLREPMVRKNRLARLLPHVAEQRGRLPLVLTIAHGRVLAPRLADALRRFAPLLLRFLRSRVLELLAAKLGLFALPGHRGGGLLLPA